MSKLKDLIQELCPDGVEYKHFFEVAEYVRGVTYSKAQEIKDDAEGYNLFRANNISLRRNTIVFDDVKRISYSVKVKDSQFLKKNDILICAGSGSKDHIGKVAFIFNNMDYTFGGFMGVIRSKGINPRYLFHILLSPIFKNHLAKVSNCSTINNINNETWADFEFPVPPLPIQEEIARILDKFTELEAELEARRKQRAFVREKMLTFYEPDKDVEWKALGEIAAMQRGSSITRNDSNVGTYPVVSGGINPSFYCDTYNRDGETITVAGSGVNAGYVKYWNEPIFVNDAFSIKGTDKVSTKYLYYYLINSQERIYNTKRGAGIPHVHISNIENFKVPIPSLEIQNKIVKVLDNFDAVCSDLKIGLPAEISARRKQYEFYRDVILTFVGTGEIVHDLKTNTPPSSVIEILQYIFGVVWMPLENIFNIRNGYTPSKAVDEYWTNGTVDWFRMEDIRTNGHVLSEAIQKVSESAIKGGRKIPANSIALSTSATIGEHALITIDCLGNQRFTFFTLKDDFIEKVDMFFMNHYFYMIDEWCKNNVLEGNFANVDMDKLKKLPIPIPCKIKQNEIVNILDKFEKLCNDLTSGLPAEIKARRAQYSYFRDKVLTFERKVA